MSDLGDQCLEDVASVDESEDNLHHDTMNLELDKNVDAGSMDYLDAIALTTSPTMESLDLGDNRSIDSFRFDQSQNLEESVCLDDDKGIEITALGSDNDNSVSSTNNDNLINDIPTEQLDSDNKNDALGAVFNVYESSVNEKESDQPVQMNKAGLDEPEPRISDYFSKANTDDYAFFDAIVPAPSQSHQPLDGQIEYSETATEIVHSIDSVPIVVENQTRQKHRSGSTFIETPSCSFEGENELKDKVGSVSDLLMENGQTDDKSEKAEFFEHFTAEGAQNQDIVKEVKRKSSGPYIMPHLSPGPSPDTSAYASPVHQQILSPGSLNAPIDTTLLSSSHVPSSYTDDFMGTPPFGASAIALELDDPFSASLKMSEADRRRDAWMPSDTTRLTLATMMTTAPGTFYPRQDQLTMPGVLLDERQGDPVVELMYKCMNDHEVMKRQTLTADMVSQDEEGLRKLIRAECFRSALDLTSKLLTLYGQGMGRMNLDSKNTANTLQIWFVRAAMLIKLKLYQVADSELVPFANFDKPDMYYEFYPELYPGRRGTMVPFALRILYAELPQFLGRAQEALDRLYYIHAIVKKMIANLDSGLSEDGGVVELADESRIASRSLWEKREIRILYSIVTVLVGGKMYDAAIEVMETLVTKDSNNIIPIICAIGRLYLQMGDIPSAREHFDQLERLLDENDDLAMSKLHMNRGFIALGVNDFETAKQSFQMVVELDPGNGVAVNNMAVCCLYTGKLKEALHILESLVQANPARYLQDGILINLCTLYELESSRALQKKQQLLNLVAAYKGNGFNVSCLKMGELMMKK